MKKNERTRPLMMRRSRGVLLLISVALIFTVAVGVTFAWLVDGPESVKNTFTPAQVECEIVEVFSGSAKSSIKVQNPTGDKNVDAYMRVSLVANWVDASGNVVESLPNFAITPANGWVKDGNLDDNFYYCTSIVKVGETTPELLSSHIVPPTPKPAGAHHFQVLVSAQAIQAAPFASYTAAWEATQNNG